MNQQYQLFIQYVEGHLAPMSLPTPSLKDAVELRRTYDKLDIHIVRIVSEVMTEQEIEQEINDRTN